MLALRDLRSKKFSQNIWQWDILLVILQSDYIRKYEKSRHKTAFGRAIIVSARDLINS